MALIVLPIVTTTIVDFITAEHMVKEDRDVFLWNILCRLWSQTSIASFSTQTFWKLHIDFGLLLEHANV